MVLQDKVSIWLTEHTRKNHYAACLTFARNDSWEKRKDDTKKSEVKEKKMTEDEKRQSQKMARELIDKLKKI